MSATIKIASYNIRKSVGLDWKRDPDRIVNIISELNADVIVLQEADRRLGKRSGTLPIKKLEQDLGYLFAPLAINKVSHGWHGNAILYRKCFTFIDCKRIEISRRNSRGAVSITLCQQNGRTFECIGVHLGLTAGSRQKQIAAICHYMEQRDNHYPTIITGDFNEWRKTRKLETAFGPDYSVLSPGPSFHTALPKLALDYFLLWGGVEENIPGYVLKTESSRKGSDHFPIVLSVRLPVTEQQDHS